MERRTSQEVYELLGAKGVSCTQFPTIGRACMNGTIGFSQHEQGHTPLPNWPYCIAFAQKYFQH